MRDTIDMAREAGHMVIDDYYTNGPVRAFSAEQLKRFEAFVRADEREACAKVCDSRALEYDGFSAEQNASEKLAAAIRNKGNT